MAGIELWVIGWIVGGVVALAVALLLIAILATASGIRKEASRVREAVRRIDGNTKAIWNLGRTAKRFSAIRDYTETLEHRIARIGTAPAGEDAGRRET